MRLDTLMQSALSKLTRSRDAIDPRHLPPAPFDSFTEQRLWKRLEWALHPDCEFQRQVRVGELDPTAVAAPFFARLDFRLVMDRRMVGVEVDGEAWHEVTRDQLRDSKVLGLGFCDTIYRLPGNDVWNRTDACVAALAMREPQFFAHGARRWLAQFSREAAAIQITKRAVDLPVHKDVES